VARSRHYPGIFREGLRKTTKISVRIVDVPPEIQTTHFPNTSLECYRYISLFAERNRKLYLCEIRGSYGADYADNCFLGCDAVQSGARHRRSGRICYLCVQLVSILKTREERILRTCCSFIQCRVLTSRQFQYVSTSSK
jgi:hypothetical protein